MNPEPTLCHTCTLCEFCTQKSAQWRCSYCHGALCCSLEHSNLNWDFAHKHVCPVYAKDKNTELAAAPGPHRISRIVSENTAYRRVFFTRLRKQSPVGAAFQMVAMSIKTTVGWERHAETTQYFLVKQGRGKLFSSSESADRARAKTESVEVGSAWFIPFGVYHDVENTAGQETPLKLLTVYFPPHHAPATLHMTMQDAQKEVEFSE